MFYFCDEAIRIPDLEGVDQLAKAVKFRESRPPDIAARKAA